MARACLVDFVIVCLPRKSIIQSSLIVIQVHNLTGTLLFERSYSDVTSFDEKIDMGGFVNGMYFVTIAKNSGAVKRKLLKL